MVQYKYDAWGKPIGKTGSMASTLGTIQPFRYRGYVYDEEIGLYYLRSRYYYPEWYRFLSSDRIISRNMYSYASNRPIVAIDRSGKDTVMLPFARMGIGNIICAIFHDGTSGARLSDIFNGPVNGRSSTDSAGGLDPEAIDAWIGWLSGQLLGIETNGEVIAELANKGGLILSTGLIMGGFRRGGVRGAAAGAALALVVMITSAGVGSIAREALDGGSAQSNNDVSKEVMSGIADIPFEFVKVETSIRTIDRMIDKVIDFFRSKIIDMLLPE